MERHLRSERKFWRIDGYEGGKHVFRKFVPLGLLSDGAVAALLQRLACKGLTEEEIIAASLRKNARNYSPLLEAHVDRAARRYLVTCDGGLYHYAASVWTADELRARGELPG